MRLEILGAIFAMIAPFVFHFLLQTDLRMSIIILIMVGIALLSVAPAVDFTALNHWAGQLPPNLPVIVTLVLAVIIPAAWQYNHWRKRAKRNSVRSKDQRAQKD